VGWARVEEATVAGRVTRVIGVVSRVVSVVARVVGVVAAVVEAWFAVEAWVPMVVRRVGRGVSRWVVSVAAAKAWHVHVSQAAGQAPANSGTLQARGSKAREVAHQSAELRSRISAGGRLTSAQEAAATQLQVGWVWWRAARGLLGASCKGGGP